MPKAHTTKPTPARHFEARLERMRSRLNWVVIHLPFDAAKVWRLRGQIKVKGEINGFAFRTSLFPTGDGRHFLLVNKRMQRGARAVEGSVARFQMEFDREERTVAIPEEIGRILNQDRRLHRWYGGLNHSTRADIAKWITEPKGAEARVRRAEQIAERLMNVMRRSGNCRLFCRWRSRGILAPAKVGMPCRPRGAVGICLAFSIIELRTLKGGESTRCWKTLPCWRRKSATRTTRERETNSWDYRLAVVILEAVRTANARAGVPASHARTLLSSTFYRTMTNVTPRAVFVCYTAVNAFATVCSLSGDPVGSAPPPHFLPAVRFPRQFQCERQCELSSCV